MTETPEPEASPEASSGTSPEAGKKTAPLTSALETLDKASKISETATLTLNTIKWVAIAITISLLSFGGYSLYKIITAPAKIIGQTKESVTDAVQSGTEALSENAQDIFTRLDIPVSRPSHFNAQAETAFSTLSDMNENPPETLTARSYWAANLRGHENRVCQLTLDFGGGEIGVLIAADNKSHARAKSLGSQNDRLMRIIIRTQDDDLPLRVEWNTETRNWDLKWRATTVSKPLEDKIAQARILDILKAVKTCAK